MPTFEENHAALPERLGRLVANLLSLESSLRLFLLKVDGDDFVDLNPHAAPVGEWLNLTALTDFRPLSHVVDRYNKLAEIDGESVIESKIVELRNAIAHGRLGAVDGEDCFRLIKYGSPEDGKVRVEFNQECSEQWFKEVNGLVREAIIRVNHHMSTRFPGSVG